MKMNKTVSALALTIALAGFGTASNAATYVSQQGSTMVFTTLAGALSSTATSNVTGVPVSTGVYSAPYAGSLWVSPSQYVVAGSAISAPGGTTSTAPEYNYYFTFNEATAFTLSGDILSDNNLLSISLVSGTPAIVPVMGAVPGGTNVSFTNGPGDQDENGVGSYTLPGYGAGGGAFAAGTYTLIFSTNNQFNAAAPYDPTAIDYRITTSPAAVPEPSTYAAFGIASLGLLGLMVRGRKTRRMAA